MTTISLQETPLKFINGGIAPPPPSPDSEYRFYKCILTNRGNYTCQRTLYDDDKLSYNTCSTLIPISKNIPQLFDKAIIYYKLFPRINMIN